MWPDIFLHEGDSITGDDIEELYIVSCNQSDVANSLPVSKRVRDHWTSRDPEAVCGWRKPVTESIPVGTLVEKHTCLCSKPSIVEVAESKRKFLSCESKRCKYFRWADTMLDPPFYKLAHESIRWDPLCSPRYQLLPTKPPEVFEKIVQGSLGDCWFLSAVAILCNNDVLFNKVVSPPLTQGQDEFVTFNLCVDGVWKNITVDSYVPVYLSGKKKDLPVFARPKDNVSFGPLIEKAYAKVYGSYASLHGGQVAEALFDLTGCPVETLKLSGEGDLDELWTKMVSWNDNKFLIGCSTSITGFVQDEEDSLISIESKGLVTMHAYSVISFVELFDVAVGKQLKLTDMFGKRSEVKGERIDRLRLVQIRNPWGRREWQGDWGSKSDKWTKTLANHIPDYKDCEGKFWMQFEDFVQAFEEIDVAKTHADWFSIAVETRRRPFTVAEILGRLGSTERVLHVSSPFVPCWCYITLIQPSTRSDGRDGYTNLGLLLLRDEKTVHAAHFGKADRVMTIEAFLEPGVEYAIVIFALGDVPELNNRNVLRIFSAEQLVLKDRMLEPCRKALMSSSTFELMVAQNLPLVQRMHICDGADIDLVGTNCVAAWILVVAETCVPKLRVAVKLSQPKKSILTGNWSHEIHKRPGGYKTVLGIAANTKTRGYYEGALLDGIDFEVELDGVS